MTAERLVLSETYVLDPQEVPEYVQAVWARRAARLAQVSVEEDAGERDSLVLVQLGQDVYGLEAQYVFDIRPVQHITRVPRTPQWIAGIVNLRGRIISVLDLRRFFGLPEVPPVELSAATNGANTPYLVVVHTDGMEIALLAENVLTVRSVPISQIQPVEDVMIVNIRPDYVRGFIPNYEPETGERASQSDKQQANAALHAERNSGAMLVILNLPTLLADKRLIIDEDLM